MVEGAYVHNTIWIKPNRAFICIKRLCEVLRHCHGLFTFSATCDGAPSCRFVERDKTKTDDISLLLWYVKSTFKFSLETEDTQDKYTWSTAYPGKLFAARGTEILGTEILSGSELRGNYPSLLEIFLFSNTWMLPDENWCKVSFSCVCCLIYSQMINEGNESDLD